MRALGSRCHSVSLIVSLLFGTAPASANAELRLDELLASALRAHPKARIAEAKVDEAESKVIEARGNFDLKTYAEGSYAPLGKYDRARGEVGLKQPTTAYGLELFAKYENGSDFAPYDGGLVTSSAGKVTWGALLPLAKGGAIDQARFERTRAQLESEIAKQSARAQRAELLAQAAEVWWKWAVTGKKLGAYERLVEQAEERQRFLQEQAQMGAIAPIEVTDNSRLLAARRAQLTSLQASFARLCLKVGLYRRGEDQEPDPADADELPQLIPAGLTAPPPNETLANQLSSAPGLRIYEGAVSVLDRELRLHKNNRLPRLDLTVYSSQSFGDPRPYSTHDESQTETTLGATLGLSWDVQQRKARGKIGALLAKRSILKEEARLLLDQLKAEMGSQLVTIKAQKRVLSLSKTATNQAEKVSEAERISFEAGQSSVLSVNLREQAVLSAYITELEAIYALGTAWVEMQRLLGSDDPRTYLPPRARVASPPAQPEEETP